jgi:hypothetical protein
MPRPVALDRVRDRQRVRQLIRQVVARQPLFRGVLHALRRDLDELVAFSKHDAHDQTRRN